MTSRLKVWQLLFSLNLVSNSGLFCYIMLLLHNESCFYDNSEMSESNNSPPTFLYRGLSVESEKGSYCATLGDGAARKICKVEWSVIFYAPDTKPLVVAKDISFGRYYAQRDLQGWTLAYNNISFEVVEQSYRISIKLADLSVFLCLGIATQDKHCIKPSSYPLFNQGQRINQIHGLRDTLWRKDGMCYTLHEALVSYQGPKNFTFPCWVLPYHMESLQVM